MPSETESARSESSSACRFKATSQTLTGQQFDQAVASVLQACESSLSANAIGLGTFDESLCHSTAQGPPGSTDPGSG